MCSLCLTIAGSGEYWFGDAAVHALNRKQRADLARQRIGMVFQSYHLLDDLTVAENIDLPLSYKNLPAKERAGMVADILDRFQIVAKKDLFPNQLSGGQQQLVGIARAVVHAPALLLADEPTGNLHSTQAREIMELFRELNKKGTTIVQVTHSDENARYGSRILELRDGWLVGDDGCTKKLGEGGQRIVKMDLIPNMVFRLLHSACSLVSTPLLRSPSQAATSPPPQAATASAQTGLGCAGNAIADRERRGNSDAGADDAAGAAADVCAAAESFLVPLPHSHNPISPYRPSMPPPLNLANSARLQDLIRDGKLYIALRDAIALAIENNLDIAYFRYNFPIGQMDSAAHEGRRLRKRHQHRHPAELHARRLWGSTSSGSAGAATGGAAAGTGWHC